MKCALCNSRMEVSEYACPACGVRLQGRFAQPRLARLEPEQLELAEQLILAGGNLKELAVNQGVSYPTLRKRLDGLMDALQRLRREDEQRTGELLTAVERGEMTPELAARLIREQSHGS